MKNATKHPYPSQDSNPGPRDLKLNALALSHRAEATSQNEKNEKKNKAPGLDEIKFKILKEVAVHINPLLLSLINKIFQTGICLDNF